MIKTLEKHQASISSNNRHLWRPTQHCARAKVRTCSRYPTLRVDPLLLPPSQAVVAMQGEEEEEEEEEEGEARRSPPLSPL